MDDFVVDRVLLAVEQIPPGRVAAYGDIGRIAGTSARRVGSVLRGYGDEVPWWRVVGAAGDPGGHLLQHARPHWQQEGIVVKPNGLGCRIADYRADLESLQAAYARALDEVLAESGTPLPPIGRPATVALAEIGVTTLEQLIEFTEAELLSLHGVGPQAIRILSLALADHGWRFRAQPQPGVT